MSAQHSALPLQDKWKPVNQLGWCPKYESAARFGGYFHSPAGPVQTYTQFSQSPIRLNSIDLKSPTHNMGVQSFVVKKCVQYAGGFGVQTSQHAPRRQCIVCKVPMSVIWSTPKQPEWSGDKPWSGWGTLVLTSRGCSETRGCQLLCNKDCFTQGAERAIAPSNGGKLRSGHPTHQIHNNDLKFGCCLGNMVSMELKKKKKD